MATQRVLMIGAALAVLTGISLAMTGLLQAQEAIDLQISSYILLGGACLCLIAAAVLGFRMARQTPAGKSKDGRV